MRTHMYKNCFCNVAAAEKTSRILGYSVVENSTREDGAKQRVGDQRRTISLYQHMWVGGLSILTLSSVHFDVNNHSAEDYFQSVCFMIRVLSCRYSYP